MSKPNCYECLHRRTVPGSAHSACAHPATEETRRSSLMELAGTLGKRDGTYLMAMAEQWGEGPMSAAGVLNISAAAQGIRGGWFIWPVNFDPVWLERCDGFTAKETVAP